MDRPPLESLPPDHYQRYLLTRNAVGHIEQELNNGKLSILDVGGHSSSLKLFLPGNQVVLLDPVDPPTYTHREGIPFRHDGYIVGLGSNLPFPDESFGVVTAHDTLEHVPPQDRHDFLAEILRVSSRFVILNGPIAGPEVIKAEKRISEFWERTLQWDSHFLKEHEEHTLPPSSLMQVTFSDRGFPFVTIPNGDFHRWFLLMAFRSYLLALSESDSLQVTLDTAYNNLISPADFGRMNYREAFIVSKSAKDLDILERAAKAIQTQQVEKDAGSFVWDLVDALESHANQIRIHMQDLHDQIETFSFQADHYAEMSRNSSQEAEAYKVELHEKVNEKTKVSMELGEARQRLDEILGSREFLAFERFYRQMTKLLPEESSRRRIARIGLRGARKFLTPSTQTRFQPDPYSKWIQAEEPSLWISLDSHLAHRPSFLIEVVVTAGTSASAIRRTVESIVRQHYLPMAIKVHSTEVDAYSREVIAEKQIDLYQRVDEVNYSSFDYSFFVRAGDVLSGRALFESAVLLNKDPAIDFLYSDHDELGPNGERINPIFTPEWSPELLLSNPYASAFCAVHRSVLESVGSVRTELADAALWDLALRATPQARNIARIPKVLVHRSSSHVRSELAETAIKAHLERRNLVGEVIHDGNVRIKWKVENSTVSVIIPTAHNRSMLRGCLRSLKTSTLTGMQVIVIDSTERTEAKEDWYAELNKEFPLEVLWWQGEFNYSAVNNAAAKLATGGFLLFLNDDIEMIDRESIEEMVGWARQDGIGLVGAHLLYENGVIQHAGIIVGLEGFAEHIFRGLLPSADTIFGPPNWYRNFLSVTGAAMMVRRELLEQLGGWDESFSLCGSDVELGLRARRAGYRSLVTPFARFRHLESATRGTHVPLPDFFTSFWNYQPFLYGGDPYFNPNLSYQSSTPALRLEPESRPSEAVSSVLGRNLTPFRQQQGGEAAAFSEICQVDGDEFERTQDLHSRNSGRIDVETINWFIPDIDSPFYGGIHTIFRFANYFQQEYAVRNRFIVVGGGPQEFIRSGLKAAFPALASSEVIVGNFLADPSSLADLPECDAAIATLWTTAYAVSKFPRAKRKFYFIQDFEPMFYPAGTMYGLAEESYRLGLYGLCNSLPLKEIYESQYGGKAVGFSPCVDMSFFHPGTESRKGPPYTVFLYGRPGHWRNCHELAVAALNRLKQDLKGDVRIVTAGSWAIDPSTGGNFMNPLGLLDYRDTPALYRSCDAGLVLTVSRHPSYLPLELMASGCLVVQNENPSATWLLRDGETCLTATPTANDIYRKLKLGLLGTDLRERVVSNALQHLKSNHSDWSSVIDGVFRFIEHPEG